MLITRKEKHMNQKYLVVYDLRGLNKNYDGLIKRIEEFPTSLKINNSSWLIVTSFSAVDVRDILKEYIDSDDSLFVGKLTGEAAWYNADSKPDDIKNALNKN